jgi:hypothetical protein
VVVESAVITMFVSSARAAEVKLTKPTAARPNVHLLNFIWFLRCCLVICLFYLHLRDKTLCPSTDWVRLMLKLLEIPNFDNKNF